MTQQEKDKIIKDLQEKLAEAEKIKVDEPKQPKRWKPEYNTEYHYVAFDGSIGYTDWNNDIFDEWRYLIGNCFKTTEEAKEHKKQIEYTARYKNYIEEHSEPLDWGNNNQGKYYACFMKNSPYATKPVNRLQVEHDYWDKYQGTIYASSKQIILDAIKEIGEDNFKKYVLGVK